MSFLWTEVDVTLQKTDFYIYMHMIQPQYQTILIIFFPHVSFVYYSQHFIERSAECLIHIST